MLNQLIESKEHKAENTRRSGFLVTTLGVLIAVLVSGWTYSLFAKNFGMGTGDFELSSIVAPVAVSEEPPPKPDIKPERTQSKTTDKIILKDLYADMATTKTPPRELTGAKEVVSAQKFDLRDVKLGDINQIPENAGRTGEVSTDGNCGLCAPEKVAKANPEPEEREPEVVVKQTPAPTVKKVPTLVSLGVINGKAAYLAKPPYPAAARAIRAEGAVNVQVTIDESGKVISASVASGHPLLRAVSLDAARQSRFTPTLLSNQPVKVTGVIVYQFKP